MQTFTRHRTNSKAFGGSAPVLAGQLDRRVVRQRRDIRHMLGRSRYRAKHKVSEPNDPLEREADRVADRVMAAGPVNAVHQAAHAGPSVQLVCADCAEEVAAVDTDVVHRQLEPAEEEQVQSKRADGGDVYRQAVEAPEEPAEEEEEVVQVKATDGQQGHGAADVALVAGIGAGRPLPAGLRSFFEPRFGQSFENVRIHTDGRANAAADALNAHAFAHGRDVAFAKGAYQPDTGEGRRLIAHELAHTIQQGQNRQAQNQQGESDDAVQRKVVGSQVDCQNPSKKQQKTVGKDPVGTIAVADARAIKMIDLVISVLEAGRQRIIDRAPIAWPMLSASVAVGLLARVGLDNNHKADCTDSVPMPSSNSLSDTGP